MQSGVVFNSGIFCLNLPNARLTGMRHYSLVVGGLLAWNRCSFYFSPLLQENLSPTGKYLCDEHKFAYFPRVLESLHHSGIQCYWCPRLVQFHSSLMNSCPWESSSASLLLLLHLDKATSLPDHFVVCEETCRMCSQAPWTNDQYRIRHDSIWFPLFLFHWRLICLGASLGSAPARPPTGVLWT